MPLLLLRSYQACKIQSFDCPAKSRWAVCWLWSPGLGDFTLTDASCESHILSSLFLCKKKSERLHCQGCYIITEGCWRNLRHGWLCWSSALQGSSCPRPSPSPSTPSELLELCFDRRFLFFKFLIWSRLLGSEQLFSKCLPMFAHRWLRTWMIFAHPEGMMV